MHSVHQSGLLALIRLILGRVESIHALLLRTQSDFKVLSQLMDFEFFIVPHVHIFYRNIFCI